GPCFRYERPQAGRYRQHHQFNVEAIGEQDPAVDLEVMSVAWHLYEDLGFKGLSFQLNSIGCPKCRPDFLKVLVEYYRGHIDDICDDCRRRLERNPLRLLDCKTKSCQPIIDAAPNMREHLCDECAEHFQTLLGYLDSLGRPYTLSHRLVRGLDYYTKTVFEVWAEGIGAQNAVCGGGRYDGLAEVLGGPPTPGVGFGSGLERIILVMEQLGVEVPPLPAPRVFLAHLGPQARREALRLADALRRADVGTWLPFGERGLRSQLREAGKRAMRYVVILGEDELASGTAMVRDMQAGEQTSVELAELVEWLRVAVSS
ncbi:MAG: histidine--tRNA ligase, partial [Anaerolineae bacterium]|nr:histidine--tRNA ligase [Anaerolineae bacterium]